MNRKLTKPIIISGALVLITVCAAAIWLYYHRMSSVIPIVSIGGENLELSVNAKSVYFLQTDPQWGNDAIGGSGEALSSVGCTISAVAMAAGSLGYDINPGKLNTRLISNEGYTDRGWLIWDKVSIATEGKIAVRVPRTLEHGEIDRALQAGSIPIVKYFLPNGIPHWVAIVGKSRGEYLVKDPLDSNKQIKALSEKTKTIVSVRYVEKH